MRKIIASALLGMLVLMGLNQCTNKKADKLVGVWQLQEMVVGGTVLKGNSLGTWLWEFNEAGGYLTDVAGVREKGVYTYKDSLLTLKITFGKKRPEAVYKVANLDTAQLYLQATDQSKSTLLFIKRKVSDISGGEKD